MLKSVQENRDSRLDLAGDSRLQAIRRCTRARHARSWSIMLAGALQDKIRQLAVLLSRDSVKPRVFWKTWFFTFHSHPSINTPYTHERKRASRENFERETLVLYKMIHPQSSHKRLFKFLNSLPLHCQTLERLFTKTVFSLYPLLWKGCLVFWEAVRKEPIYISWCYGQVAESGKLEKK